jgi:hypothetical protein
MLPARINASPTISAGHAGEHADLAGQVGAAGRRGHAVLTWPITSELGRAGDFEPGGLSDEIRVRVTGGRGLAERAMRPTTLNVCFLAWEVSAGHLPLA